MSCRMELSVMLPRTPQSLASPVDQVSTLRVSLLSHMKDKQLVTMYDFTDERTSLMQCSSQCAGERGRHALVGLTTRCRGGCTIGHACPLACRPTMFPGEFLRPKSGSKVRAPLPMAVTAPRHLAYTRLQPPCFIVGDGRGYHLLNLDDCS